MIESVFLSFAHDPADYAMTSRIQTNLYHSAREAVCKLHWLTNGMSAKTSHSWRRIWIFGNEPQRGFEKKSP